MKNRVPALILTCAVIFATMVVCWAFAAKRPMLAHASHSSQTGQAMTRLVPGDRFAQNNAPHRRIRNSTIAVRAPINKPDSFMDEWRRFVNPQETAIRWIQ